MRKTCFGLVLAAGLCVSAAASAADNTVVGVGTGAVAGAVVGGPIGAVVGAVAGGFIGANSESARPRYRRRARASSARRAAASSPRPARLAANAVEQPAPRPVFRRPASEIVTSSPAAGETTGSARREGWQDPH